jgi:hypothetical protein
MQNPSTVFAAIVAAILSLLAVALGTTIGLMASWSDARAHSFYDPECCSDKDCAPIDSKLVRITDSGYVVTVGPGQHPMVKHAPVSFVIPYHTARESPDGRYHVCITEQHVSPDGTAQFGASMLCFYRPPMSY